MRAKLISAHGLLWLSIALVLVPGGGLRAQAADMKFQAFLLWGTDNSKPPAGKTYQPVAAEIRNKLKELPIKWTNWFEVNRKSFTVTQREVSEVAISEKCHVKVKKLGESNLEVSLIGKGKEVMKRRQSLPQGEMLVLGGNAPNSTAWLVVLKRTD
jgi:hypothetical protein